MQVILLSGGSGKRLWPLSNNIRSKQFLQLLPTQDGSRESMVQRVTRQLRESGVDGAITVATSILQKEIILQQLGKDVSIVAEPERRDTFPAIALASTYLALEKGCGRDEVVVVMPCDPFTEKGYFDAIGQMVQEVEKDVAELVLMGIRPTYPSSKFGYVVPINSDDSSKCSFTVKRFTEKPNEEMAKMLIGEGAFWNGGVFAFKLGYMMDFTRKYIVEDTFEAVRSRYAEFPKISFDYEVAEKAKSVAVVPFDGQWKDLGTWNALAEELGESTIGNVVMDEDSTNSQVINELEIPIMTLGVRDLVIVASKDGILVTDRNKSEEIKSFAERIVK